MNKTSKIIIGAIVVIIIVWVIAARSASSPTAKEPVRIGGAYILTGPASLVGELQKSATAMAVKEINDAGGINGRPLEVVQEDAQYESKTALNAYQALKLRGIKFFIADGSPVAAPIRPMVIADGNFMIVPGATAPSYFDGENRTCRIALTAKNFGPKQSDLMMKRGYKGVATFYPDNEAGRGFYDEFKKAFEAAGGKIVVAEFYSASGNGDYRTNLSKIKERSKDIDAVLLQQVLNTIEPMFKQIAELGINKPIVTDYYTINNPAWKDLSLANGVEFVDYEYSKFDQPTDSDRVKAFKADYKKLYGKEPSYFSASTYDSIYLIAGAVKAVGEDPAKVGSYISGLKNYKGVTGTYSFDSDCEVSRKTLESKVVDGNVIQGVNKF